MRSPRKVYIERVRALCLQDDSERYFDLACQVRVYRRGTDGSPEPSEWLENVYGGRYDALLGRYTGESVPVEKVAEVSIHTGQRKFFEFLNPESFLGIGKTEVRRVLGLGAQGGGKTMGIVKIAQCLCALRPNSLGGIVAPTRDRLDIIWAKFLEVVEPLGWIKGDPRPGKKEITLKNNTTVKFVAAKRSSNKTGSPIAGRDWHWAVEDEQQNIDADSLREVDARGRITPNYRVYSSATNDPIHEFQIRVQEYEANPERRIVRFDGFENCFTPLEHWESLRRNWSAADFDRYIRCLDIPQAGRVYPEFSYAESMGVPQTADITGSLTGARYETAFPWVVGFDPGILVSASVICKAYSGLGRDERSWFVHDEITTRDKTTEWHAQDLQKWFRDRGVDHTNEVLVLMDPHENKEADRSDLLIMRAAGFNTFRSNGGVKIERRHRISMMNALLRDATGRRRLFLFKNSMGVPQPNKLAESLGHLMYRANGEIEMQHKTASNLAHWSDALGYALFPFEHFRGGYKPVTPTIVPKRNPWASRS